LAADRPAMVRSVILVAAGGLIAPPTSLGSMFRDAPPTKLTGPECVALGARWLSPALIQTSSHQSSAGRRSISRTWRPADAYSGTNGGRAATLRS
jgi:hypothetical protein